MKESHACEPVLRGKKYTYSWPFMHHETLAGMWREMWGETVFSVKENSLVITRLWARKREPLLQNNCSVSQRKHGNETPWFSGGLLNQISRRLIWLPLHHRPTCCLLHTTVISVLTDSAISIQRLHKLFNRIKAKEVIFQHDIHNVVTGGFSALCSSCVPWGSPRPVLLAVDESCRNYYLSDGWWWLIRSQHFLFFIFLD